MTYVLNDGMSPDDANIFLAVSRRSCGPHILIGVTARADQW